MRCNNLLLIIIVLLVALLVVVPIGVVKADDLPPVTDDPLATSIPQEEGLIGGNGLDYVGCTRINTEPINAAFEQRVVELVNIERAKVGAAPLKRNSELDYAARYHSRDMYEDNYIDHNTMDRVNGSLVKQCGPFDRIKLYYSGYSYAGENAALGYLTPEDVVAGWMASEGHRGNILKPEYREIGIGYYKGSDTYRVYWTQVFGAKASVYPVIINDEAEKATSNTVSLYMYGTGVWNEVRIQTDNGAWSNWMPFSSRANWELEPVNGTHILSAEFRTMGQSAAAASSSDTITLTGFSVEPPSYSAFLPVIFH